MLMNFKIIDYATHLLHILALIGCGHFLQIGEFGKAIECSVTGSLCVLMLASSEILVNRLRGK